MSTRTTDPKRVDMPRTKGLRIEAPGCVIYIDHHNGGTLVDVVPDGNRFADQGIMLGRCAWLEAGQRVYSEPSALSQRIVVGCESEVTP